MKSSAKNKNVKTKTTKSAVKKSPARKIKVAAPAAKKVNKSETDREFDHFIAAAKNTKQTSNSVSVAAPRRRKEKFVDPHVLMKLESARGIIKDNYSLPTIQQYNKAVKDGLLTGQPIIEKE